MEETSKNDIGHSSQREENVYAFNIENKVIHVSEAESGRKGYYCLGCNGELQAKKGNIRQEHFAHDPKNLGKNVKCSYSDETYRHKLAKELLQTLKKIKVPSVIKEPPKGTPGLNYLIRHAHFIEAHTVRIELPFYEDENGNIRHSEMPNTSTDSTEKSLYVKPDVTFLNAAGLPVLFIEIVATHKPDREKILKFRYLGIDAVQIVIPKESPEQIENALLTTQNTKWIFNNDYEKTDYFSIAQGGTTGISSIDDEQRKIFKTAESYECRAAQINNLIRGIRRSLESESYSHTYRELGEQIQRVERNTREFRGKWEELCSSINNEIREKFNGRRKGIEDEEALLKKEHRLVEAKDRDLEKRYLGKRAEFERTREEYRSPEQSEIDRIEEAIRKLGVNPDDPEEGIRNSREDAERIESLKRQTEDVISTTLQYIGTENQRRERIQGEKRNLRSEFRQSEDEFRAGIEIRRRQSVDAIEARDSERISGVSRRLGEIREIRERLLDLRKSRFTLLRNRKLKELLDKEFRQA